MQVLYIRGATVQAQTPLVKADPAYNIWLEEIQTLSDNTKKLYREYFDKFLEYTGKTATQLLETRILEVATHEKPAKAIFEKANTPLKALISTINDTGLGVSDIRHLKTNLILENPEAQIIHIRMIRQKTGDRIHTFLGEEAIKLLKDYLNLRRTGTEKIAPEIITPESPLFRTWQH